MTDYLYKTPPYPHQEREFIASRDHLTWAIFFAQRTGKTKLSLDTAAYNYERGKIDAVFITAPTGVHAQWILDEIPAHLPDRIPRDTLIWRTGRAPKTFQKRLDELIGNKDALVFFAMNTQALITKAGRAALEKFLRNRRVLFIFDESADIRTPSARTTRMAWKMGKMAVMRRILAGVPAPEGPMDMYAQYRFLHHRILDCKNFMEYKLRYGEWEARNRLTMAKVPLESAILHGDRLRKGLFMLPKKDEQGRPIYKNLDDLRRRTSIRTSRVTLEEAFPHLPPKQYQRFYVDLDPEQVRLYNQLTEEYSATLDARTLDVPLLITRFVRLQQVICGYLPMPITEEVDPDFDWFAAEDAPEQKVKYEIVRIPGVTARVEVLDDIIKYRGGDPVIIWARFKPDIDLLMEHIPGAARYDGSVSTEEREDTKHRFQAGQIPVLIGNQKAGGTGLTLKPAQTVIYYSNYFGLLPRLQSEDRPIHGSLTRPVLYADLVARHTIEEKLVNALRHKQDLFKELMGDRQSVQDWLRPAA